MNNVLTVEMVSRVAASLGDGFANRAGSDLEKFISHIESLGLDGQKEYFVLLRMVLEDLKAVNLPETADAEQRISVILRPQDRPLSELFPLFARQDSVEVKKEFSLNFGGQTRIEKERRAELKEKLTSGLTLQQHIDKVREWFNSLQGDDLGNWLKLFGYVQSVKEYERRVRLSDNFKSLGNGFCCFGIKLNKDFFAHFIKPDKKSGQFTTRAKARFMKWLYDNQRVIEFPLIVNGKVWNMPIRIYEYAENLTDKELFFKVNTDFLESEFNDYVSINLEEIDAIAIAWENLIRDTHEVTAFSLDAFRDVPLKFLLTLKTIYNREGNYRNGDFAGNVQRLSRQELDAHLGGLSSRIRRKFANRDRIRTGNVSGKPKDLKTFILETTFALGILQKWILTEPVYENGVYKFNINAGYFDRKRTAKRLASRTQP